MMIRAAITRRPKHVCGARCGLALIGFTLFAVGALPAQTIIVLSPDSFVDGTLNEIAVAPPNPSSSTADQPDSPPAGTRTSAGSPSRRALPAPDQLPFLGVDAGLASAPQANLAATVTLSDFSGALADGSIRPGTTWVGQVTQNSASITVGGSARDDNGWGVTGLSLNATGLTYLNITAQRDFGNAAPSLFLQFEDRFLNTHIAAIDTSLFAMGTMSFVQLSLGPWSAGFDPTQITGWTLGGGGLGTTDFRMTFQNMDLTSIAAIPEPSVFSLLGMGAFLLVGWRRLHKRLPKA